MIENPETGALENFNFDQLLQHVPELKRCNYRISSYQFDPPIDSSDMEPSLWAKIVKIINYNYDNFDGFVILHGTDTMAYTASALSFMLENLSKPVILTGSQLPIGTLRTDGKENLITAIEIAAAKHPDGTPIVPEVCIFFENELMRGNRTTKINAENFNAFRLIFCCSAGTEYETYFDRLAEIEESYYKKFAVQFSAGEKVDDFFIHVICRTGWQYVYELVSHNMDFEKAKLFMDDIRKYSYAGWKAVLGLT